MRDSKSLAALGALILFGACDQLLAPPIDHHRPDLGKFVTDISFPTYERSGQSVHPDASPAWNSGQHYLALTPYPGGNAEKENPSFFTSTDELNWFVPPGAPNPVVTASSGYLSDPDIVFNPATSELWMYYRQVSGDNVIQLVRSRDGVHWSSPVTVAQAPSHMIVSPAVVRLPDGHWRMWSVNSGGAGCTATKTSVELRESADGIAWGPPKVVDMPLPPSGLYPWHIEVQWVQSRGEYWALFNSKDGRSCGTTALYIAQSADGMHWVTQRDPLLVAGDVAELDAIVYRSTFEYDAARDEITFWYSGARNAGTGLHWSTISQRVSRSAVFPALEFRAQSKPRDIPAGVDLIDPP